MPGALNVPYGQALTSVGRLKPEAEIRAMFESAGVDLSKPIVNSCGSGVTACHTLLALEIAGIRGASLYVGSWSEWCRNPRPRAHSGRSDGAPSGSLTRTHETDE